MKVEDLLLTAEEQVAAKRDAKDKSIWHARDDALCRAQAGKVLAVLITHFYALRTERGDYAANSISDIMVGVGLTWPSKEG